MQVKMRKDLYRQGYKVPVSNIFYSGVQVFEARYSKDGQPNDDGDEMQINFNGIWSDIVSTDWDFVD